MADYHYIECETCKTTLDVAFRGIHGRTVARELLADMPALTAVFRSAEALPAKLGAEMACRPSFAEREVPLAWLNYHSDHLLVVRGVGDD
jgi:hypothetical protein